MTGVCPIKDDKWHAAVAKVKGNENEVKRIWLRNNHNLPDFVFTDKQDAEDYILKKYPNLFKRTNMGILLRTGGSYEQYLHNIKVARTFVEHVNKVYHDVLELEMRDIKRPSEFSIGRTKLGILHIKQVALDNHYRVWDDPDYKQLQAEGQFRVTDEGEVIPNYEQQISKGLNPLTPEQLIEFEQQKTRMRKVFPRIKEIIKDYTIPQAGLLEANGTIIRVNPNYMTRDTIGHEFAHLLIDLMGGLSNPLIKQAREKLRGTKLEQRVLALCADLVEAGDDRIDKEVLAQAIGEETVRIFEEEKLRNWWDKFLMRMFGWLKRKLGIEVSEVRELAGMVVGKIPIEVTYQGEDISEYEQRKQRSYRVKADEDLSEIERLRRKALDALKMKHAIYHRKDIKQRAESVAETLKKLEALKYDPVESLKVFQAFAIEQTDRVYEDYRKAKHKKEKKRPGQAYQIRTLARWKDYMHSFDMLEEILDAVRKSRTSFDITTSKLGDAIDIDKLTETISRKNEIKNAYMEEGMTLITDFLMPYSTHIQAEFKEQFEKDYNKLPKDKRKAMTVDDYIQQQMGLSQDEISQETRRSINRELIKAYSDVSQITRWLDNVLDSPDVLVSSMVKAFAETIRVSRLKQKDFRHEFLEKLRVLEKFKGTNILQKDEAFYDFMLEKNEKGELTGYLVDSAYNYIWIEYDKYSKALEKKLKEGKISANEMVLLKQDFKRRNMPLSEDFKKAKEKYLQSLVDQGLINAAQKKAILNNDALYARAPYNSVLYSKIKKLEDIVTNDEAVEQISDWLNENIRKYRKYNTQFRYVYDEKLDKLVRKDQGWSNPQWTALVKMAGGNPRADINQQFEALKANKTKDPRVDFYNFLMSKNEELQKNLPYIHRLRNRLPAIMKDFNQRVKAGDNIADILKGTVKRGLAITSEYEERGDRSQLTDESGNAVHFLPIYYTGTLDKKDQSYDVADIYFKYLSMSIDFAEKSEILPQMEMIRFFVNNRDVQERDSKGNPVMKAIRGLRDRELDKKGNTSNIAAQLNDWFEAIVYGIRSKDEGKLNLFGAEIDLGRAADLLNKYTALNLLGLNFVQGTANVLLGSSLQLIESIGKEYYTPKQLAKANAYYWRKLPGVLGDIGLREPENVINLLNEEFDTLNEWVGTDFRKSTKFRQLMKSNTLFFTSHAGEHFMQTKVMLALLEGIQAKDEKGNVLGSMLDVAKAKNGKLVFEGKNGEKVANFTDKDKFELEAKLKRVLSRLHGEYSEMGKVAIQRYALGRMAYMFRKFIVPGFRRRWGKKYVNNFTGDYVEGNYRTFGRFVYQMFKDFNVFRLSMWQENWQDLTRMEKANVVRTMGEIIFLTSAIIMANVFINLKSEADDDEEWLYSFLAYQVMRLRAEMAFYVMPSEAMKILRSPAAAMSVMENMIKLWGQLFDPLFNGEFAFERYERGNWKGQLKINRTLVNFVPGMKQIYRLRDIDDQLNWLKK